MIGLITVLSSKASVYSQSIVSIVDIPVFAAKPLDQEKRKVH